MFAFLGYFLCLLGCGAAFYFAGRLFRWENHLRSARVVITYKGKVKMNPTLYEWLQWAIIVSNDKSSKGRVVYHANSTSVAIIQPRSHEHGKTKTQIVTQVTGNHNGTTNAR